MSNFNTWKVTWWPTCLRFSFLSEVIRFFVVVLDQSSLFVCDGFGSEVFWRTLFFSVTVLDHWSFGSHCLSVTVLDRRPPFSVAVYIGGNSVQFILDSPNILSLLDDQNNFKICLHLKSKIPKAWMFLSIRIQTARNDIFHFKKDPFNWNWFTMQKFKWSDALGGFGPRGITHTSADLLKLKVEEKGVKNSNKEKT